jgi:hypothetical protein
MEQVGVRRVELNRFEPNPHGAPRTLAMPASSAEYWHMGAMTIRFASVIGPT